MLPRQIVSVIGAVVVEEYRPFGNTYIYYFPDVIKLNE